MSLQLYLEEHGIKHFTAREFCPVGKLANGKGPELLPCPMPLWGHAVKTLTVLEWLREQLGAPIIILSGYRDPQYNRAIGGASKSLHTLGNATDIRVKGVRPKQVAAKLETHPDAEQFGIGRYEMFTHIDTRGLLGLPAPARWFG
jgi:hypothetical protein